MNNSHINFRKLGIAVVAPAAMLLIQNITYTVVSLTGITQIVPYSLVSYTVTILFFGYIYLFQRHLYMADEEIIKNRTGKINHSILCGFIVVILIIATGICLQVLSTGILNIIDRCHPELLENYHDLISRSFSMSNGSVRVFTVMFMAPIAEELVFRGISLGAARSALMWRKSDILAVILSALLFGLAHGNTVQFCYAFPVGIILAIITVWSSSLILSMLLHITINVSSYVMDYIPATWFCLSTIILSAIVAAVCITFIYLVIRRSHKKHKQPSSDKIS